LALQIAQRKDLGCLKAAGNVFTIDEAKNLGNLSHKRAFWRLLGVEEGTGEGKILHNMSQKIILQQILELVLN